MQDAVIERSNMRLPNVCLNEPWFPSLGNIRRIVEAWRRGGVEAGLTIDCAPTAPWCVSLAELPRTFRVVGLDGPKRKLQELVGVS